MLHRYSANRARPLVGRLAEVLKDVPADPLVPDWLATPSEGMRRWVLLELAARLGSSGPGRFDGICANVELAFAGSLRRAVLDADGVDGRTDPWAPGRLAWPVLEVLADEELADRLGIPRPGGVPRYGMARQIADHFDRYHLHRPDMVRSWANGEDTDGVGTPVPPDLRWEPHLWRAVRDRVGEASAPERWPSLLEKVRTGGLQLDLPPRLCLFGFSQLPTGDFLELVSAVSTAREVHLFLVEPARYDGSELRAAAGRTRGAMRVRAEEGTAALAHHPLLRSWGRSQRETAVLLADAEAAGLPSAERLPSHSAPGDPTVDILSRLQADIRANRSPTPDFDPPSDDRSVQLHACYGPGRQVAALRDALLHLLADDTTLREEDVVVLCPALDRFAPLLETVLGPSAPAAPSPPAVGAEGPPALRYRIVDPAVAGGNEVVEAALHLLDLAAGRFEAPGVVDFLSRPPVRARFGFDEDDIAAVDRWVVSTRVRWGLDPEHRVRFGVSAAVTSNTWQQALDRLLVGSAVDGGDLAVATGGVVPCPVEGGAVAAVGRLADALSQLAVLAREATTSRPVVEWVDLISTLYRSLLAVPRDRSWQWHALEGALAETVEAAGGGAEPCPVPLDYAEFRRLMREHVAARRGRNDYFRGGVTITSLIPLRGVPFRVVCLLGMDQSSLVGTNPAGDDLVQSPSLLGDPDPRSDLRQALLEAVLAAEDRLLVFRDGHNPRTNQPVPPAVAVAELRDAVLGTVPGTAREEVSRRLDVDHPCHPFDERCFTDGGLVPGRRWGFGVVDLEGARARHRRRREREPFLEAALPDQAADVVELADLHAFLADPTETFLATRLRLRMPRRSDRPESSLPVHVDPLTGWQVGDRSLRARLDGHPVEAWRVHERGLGTLPPGVLGDRVLADTEGVVDELVDCAAELGVLTGRLESQAIDLALPGGIRLVGEVPLALGTVASGAAVVTYSRRRPVQKLHAWLDLMALSAMCPSATWRSVVVCRDSNGGATWFEFTVATSSTDGDPPPTPLECLDLAATLFRLGLAEPLPLFPKVSEALCHRPTQASGLWRSPPGAPAGPGEGERAAVELVYGRASLEDVLELPTRDGDPGASPERSRAKRLARVLYRAVAASMRERKPSRSRSGS